jgi:hypothetical protein
MTQWIATSRKLPREGDALLFVIEYRNIVLRGNYTGCMFKSRWSRYSPVDVSEWRPLDIGAAAAAPDAGNPPAANEEHEARVA